MNHYPDVIDVLLNDGTDFRAIVVAISKKHPKLILDSLPETKDSLWKNEVDIFLRDGMYVSAIKLWREKTGSTLKDVKDAVDKRAAEKGLTV